MADERVPSVEEAHIQSCLCAPLPAGADNACLRLRAAIEREKKAAVRKAVRAIENETCGCMTCIEHRAAARKKAGDDKD